MPITLFCSFKGENRLTFSSKLCLFCFRIHNIYNKKTILYNFSDLKRAKKSSFAQTMPCLIYWTMTGREKVQFRTVKEQGSLIWFPERSIYHLSHDTEIFCCCFNFVVVACLAQLELTVFTEGWSAYKHNTEIPVDLMTLVHF